MIIRLFFLTFLFIGCAKNDVSQNSIEILAKVGDRIITPKDFQQRAEYTIRPDYCKGDLYQHKKIILNNLIAEKLLALEIESSGINAFNDGAAAFIKGRKEQAMRQLLYFKEGFSKVNLNKDEINHYYKMAGRTYQIGHFSFPGGAFLDSVNSALSNGITLEDIYKVNFNDNMPTREVRWEEPNHHLISQALFNQPIEKGEVIGPFQMEDGSYIIMKVNGWTDRKLITQKSIADQTEKVISTLKERKGVELYKSFIARVMKGKNLSFNKEVLLSYSKSISERYFRSRKEKESAISSAIFNTDELLTLEDIKPLDNNASDLTLFELDGKEWKIKDFENVLLSHPLVFRKKKMNAKEFTGQFQLAIIDLIQDMYLTEKAYEMSLDKSFEVEQSASIWRDSFLAFQSSLAYDKNQDQKDRHIKMKPIIDKLQDKYSKNIFINTDLFEKIKISRVDMFVTQSNVAYPVVVPNFPSYTDDSYLNYGSKLN